jgi:hypothetical protein
MWAYDGFMFMKMSKAQTLGSASLTSESKSSTLKHKIKQCALSGVAVSDQRAV